MKREKAKVRLGVMKSSETEKEADR